MIGEVADRVQRFLGGSGGDENPLAGEVVGQGQMMQNVLQQILRLRHLAFAHVAAGQTPCRRLDDLPAVAAEKREVVLSHGIFIHIGIHGRSDELGALAGQHRGGEHIVSQTVGQFGADVGRGRSNQDQVSPVGQGNVLHLMGEIPVKGVDNGAAARQLFKGQRGDKLRGVLGHNHLHRRVLLDQSRAESRGLIGGNAAGNAQKDGFSL